MDFLSTRGSFKAKQNRKLNNTFKNTIKSSNQNLLKCHQHTHNHYLLFVIMIILESQLSDE